MKEKAVFLVKNLLKRTLETFQGLEKKVTFNFNLIELLPANLPIELKARLLDENHENVLVELEFDDSSKAEVLKKLPENDFQGRIFETISSIYRGHLAIKTKINNPLLDYKVHCRTPYLDYDSLLGRKYGGTYGIQKIDGVDTEHEKFVLDAYAEELLSKIKIYEVKTSRIGDLTASIRSSLEDKNFNCSREHLIVFLQEKYGIKGIKNYTELEKTLSYWGKSPVKEGVDILEELIKNPNFLEKFLKLYGKDILSSVETSVSNFEFNFFSNKSFPNKDKILSVLKDSLEGSDL